MPKSLTRGGRVLAFIDEFIKTPEGSQVGKPLKLEPFQRKFIMETYNRHTRRAYLSMARKNGKSALTAALLLAHICGPEARHNTQIVSGAMSRDQAALVYHLAEKMIRLDSRLEKVCRCVPSSKRIVGLARNVEYRALAADATTAHGLSPVLAILDEIGQVRGASSPFVDAITTAQGAHERPLLIAISTQAPSDADLFSLWIDDAIRSGDPHTVCHLYAADPDADLMDKRQWRNANPALGKFRSAKDLEEQLKQAARIPAMEATARNLLLNQRVALESLWLAPGVWKENSGPPSLEALRRGPTSLGLDLSARQDLTAAVLAAKDDAGLVHLLPFVFTPESGLEARALRDRVPYDAWVRAGQMVAVPGPSVDYDFVAGYLRRELDDLGIRLSSVEFDRWRWELFSKAAEEQGLQCGVINPVGQGFRDISPRAEAFQAVLNQGKIRHGGHPLLNMAAANAIAVRDPAGNIKLDKAKSTQRIDPLVAAIMAVYAVSEGAAHDPAFSVEAIIG